MKGCVAVYQTLADIPDEWLPFAPVVAPPSASSIVSMTAISTSMSSVTSGPQTNSLSQTTTMNTSTSSAPAPTIISLGDGQIPICGISQACMKQKDDHSPICTPDDLECICKASNSFTNNTEFDEGCVYDECYGDIGKEEFLDSLIYHCHKVNKDLVDIPRRWEPYLPASGASSSAPLNGPSSSTAVPAVAPAPSQLPDSAIAGIAVAAFLAISILFGLAKLYWDTRKKANELKVANAQLQEAPTKRARGNDGAGKHLKGLL
ncbi:hypothetical protein EJ02DRAFT_244168 [Clathrospora elynae]|uniref:Extracellular membrane protein CFEM domain-containing protein n=1 Tax=Clathrospora elynae TaxID=706981 RepID=A0A6A5SIA2_9PLEO|nr:hypothetical protein EJ02DRAFT_244168 [Clathrospora elynae]